MEAPILETLGYLIMLREEVQRKNEKEEMERWVRFMSMHHSHPATDKGSQQAKKSFIKMLEPSTKVTAEGEKKALPEPAWDMKLLEQLKASQEQERLLREESG